MKKNNVLIILFLPVLLISGCAGVPVRKGSRYDGYFQAPKVVYMMPSDVKQFKITAGGVTEEMDEWEADTNHQLRLRIKNTLESSGSINVTVVDKAPIDEQLVQFLNEQNGLYRAVAQSIIMHTYTPGSIFKHKLNCFDYSLGPRVGEINDFVSADSILFVGGKRTYWTGGRILLTACAMLAGAAVGASVMPVPIPDWLAVTLVDAKTGDIIWFRYLGQPESGIGDLREPQVIEKSVDILFKDLIK